MSTGYRKHSASAGSGEFDGIATILIAFAIILIGLPAVIIGILIARVVAARISWSFWLWFLLIAPSCYTLYIFTQHGFVTMVARECADYILTIEHHQFDLTQWNIVHLWSETWPIWVHILVAIPIVALFQDLSLKVQGGQTTRHLQQNERRRQRAIERGQQRARKSTIRPEQLPDAARGMMVIGVAIADEEQE